MESTTLTRTAQLFIEHLRDTGKKNRTLYTYPERPRYCRSLLRRRTSCLRNQGTTSRKILQITNIAQNTRWQRPGRANDHQDHESLPNDDGVGKKHEHYHGTAIAEEHANGVQQNERRGER